MKKSRTSKSTIRNDPFASVIPMPAESDGPTLPPEPGVVDKKVAPPPAPPRIANMDRPRRDEVIAAAPKAGKQKLTVHLDAALADRVKNAAYWNPRLTIAGIAEQGIRHAVEKHERDYGGKYPPRDGELVGGRPIK